MRRGSKAVALAAGLAIMGLAACDSTALAPRTTEVTPQVRPAAVVKPAAPAPEPGPSAASLDLQRYYARIQKDLLVRGLLRTDGGGPDTQFTDTMLARNFERIALAEEYERGAGLTPSRGDLGAIKKWTKPIRISVEFGPRVPRDQIAEDRAWLAEYAAKLGRITGHPISMGTSGANFHVLFMSEDDKDRIKPRIQQLVPDVNLASLDLFDNLPRSIHCLVIAFSETQGGYEYGEAIAVIRSEHPDLLRRSCIHEEVAQGLGLGNDDPRARPSIFNDDDEFALLTVHDEMLLKILYDPRLRPGMSADEARPIVVERAAELAGAGSS
ncbi:DUF2927 domain-containing protein [Tropicibacter oceani]|uniref:DUF2927 domain-containing protein n=1 Tax=Tropicibacter oceani TaxID=3058420 RepID=A0ABY8QPP7_9RHOB|nr:DUF2927 domain-containing protein [Tropicibacter oceani]WGW05802.1 DUF2927 domain-containing protein [Tropicibacter oceani]